MNVFYRLGAWWESRRKVLWDEHIEDIDKIESLIKKQDTKIKALELGIKESQTIPASIGNEIKALRARVDQMELYVGLRREKKPETVPGAARIS